MKNISVAIFTYHDLYRGDKNAKSIYTTGEKRFKVHLDYLKENKYSIISLYDLRDYNNSKKVLPQNCAIISFDGPYKSWISIAAPLLAQYGFKATFFIVTGWLDNESKDITWDDLIKLKKYRNNKGEALFDIESHSVSHALLFKNPNETLEEYRSKVDHELVESKKKLDEILGQNTRFFALPFGRGDLSLVKQIAQKYGYWGIRACDINDLNNEKKDLYNIPTDYVDAIIYRPLWFKYALMKSRGGVIIKIFFWMLIKFGNISYKLRRKVSSREER